jgi:prepilin-type N-terminal cleavage/methylation domain-containing protein
MRKKCSEPSIRTTSPEPRAGFTIIETMIVLAIAGLIILLIFMLTAISMDWK